MLKKHTMQNRLFSVRSEHPLFTSHQTEMAKRLREQSFHYLGEAGRLFSAEYFFQVMLKLDFFFTHHLKPDFFFHKELRVRFFF